MMAEISHREMFSWPETSKVASARSSDQCSGPRNVANLLVGVDFLKAKEDEKSSAGDSTSDAHEIESDVDSSDQCSGPPNVANLAVGVDSLKAKEDEKSSAGDSTSDGHHTCEIESDVEDEKSRVSDGDIHVHPTPALVTTVPKCRQIDLTVSKLWKGNIRRGNCIELQKQLEEYPCLLAVVSEEGETVLHAAAKLGGLKLLLYICNLFLDMYKVKDFVHCDKHIDRVAFFQTANIYQMTAKDLLWFTMGGSRIYADFTVFEISNAWEPPILMRSSLASLEEMLFSPIEKHAPDYEAEEDAQRRMKDIVTRLYDVSYGPHFRSWRDGIHRHASYRHVAQHKELGFHFAIEECMGDSFSHGDARLFMRTVVSECVKEGPNVVKALFHYRNAQGKTPMHCALAYDVLKFDKFFWIVEDEIPKRKEFLDCFNGRDGRGWTAMHCAVARGDKRHVDILCEYTKPDLNLTTTESLHFNCKATALHLAILHNHMDIVRSLLQRGDVDVNVLFNMHIQPIGCQICFANLEQWTPLQLAVMLRRHDIVNELLDHPKVEDLGLVAKKEDWWKRVKLIKKAKTQELNPNDMSYDNPAMTLSAFHLAGIIGDPKTLRCFMNIPNFNILVTIQGCTTLHFVVDGTPLKFEAEGTKGCLQKVHFCDQDHYQKYAITYDETQVALSNKDREACISILIQGGLDVWQMNDINKFPEPGPHANTEVRYFWHQKLLSETQEAKNNLNIAGNAISVVSALVATASYVGPLQPPLGVDSNGVQNTRWPIRMYMVTNTLSFYTAVASIIFAVVPSLPMPQEGVYEEWQRSRSTIIIAIHLLLISVLNILVSFGAASNVVISSEYSWKHQGLVFYPTLLGGFTCLVSICLFYLRLFRLTFVKNLTIKHMYQKVFRATQMEKVKVMHVEESKERYWRRRRRDGLQFKE